MMVNDVPASLYLKRIGVGATASIVTMSLLAWLIHTGKIVLTGNFATDKMSGFGSKLEFTLRFLILPTLWILINSMLVMLNRLRKQEALDPLNDHEDVVQVANNVLRNSVEQLLMSMIVQLSLISYLPGPDVARVVPFMNVTFLVGRITFYAGYPKFRSFGFVMTFLPTALAITYVAYKFVVTTFLSSS